MKTILFATDHLPPDPKALDYALLLCRRITARLDVLHILPLGVGISAPQNRQKAMATDRFAQLLGDRSPARVNYHCEVTGEAPGTIVERYVRTHRNIVLTVVDPRASQGRAGRKGKAIRPAGNWSIGKLAIPLVLVKKTQ